MSQISVRAQPPQWAPVLRHSQDSLCPAEIRPPPGTGLCLGFIPAMKPLPNHRPHLDTAALGNLSSAKCCFGVNVPFSATPGYQGTFMC